MKTAQVLSLKETQLSTLMEDDIKLVTAKRDTALLSGAKSFESVGLLCSLIDLI